MMASSGYSAAATKFSFWFSEYRKVLSLVREGMGKDSIRQLSKDENIFSATTPNRGAVIASAVYARVNSMPEEINRFMDTGDLEIQRTIVIFSIMRTDRLFFEFMFEVFRDKMLVGDMVLRDSDFRTFFNEKRISSETVSEWTESSLNNLRKTYKSYLADAGITDRAIGDRLIVRPYLGPDFEDILIKAGMEPFLKALGRMSP
ncbi:MAG: DUF1819 family protein [Candidatus Methanoplasma sp.]|jgi:hypothetical protein|nr:DUF1819 family protein [Candidatus Methanoplasma sp.]